MEVSNIIIDKKEYAVLYILENDKFNYIAYEKNNKVYFAKYKNDSDVLKDVTKIEKQHLENILNKMNDKE